MTCVWFVIKKCTSETTDKFSWINRYNNSNYNIQNCLAILTSFIFKLIKILNLDRIKKLLNHANYLNIKQNKYFKCKLKNK